MATSLPAWVSQVEGGPAPVAAAPVLPAWVRQVEGTQKPAAAASTTTAPSGPTWRSLLFGPSEAAAAIGSGMVAQPLAGLAGLGDAALSRFDKKAPAPADVVKGVENALTYQPRTQGGKLGAAVAGYPFQKLAQGADWAGGKVASATGSPLAGAAVNTAIQALPLLAGAKVPALRDAPVKTPDVPPAVAAMRSLGLKITPTEAQVPGGTFGRTLESLTNHAKLERAISRKNAAPVTAISARDVGINGRVTPDSISKAYEPHDAVYKEVEAIPQIKTDDAYLEKVRGQKAPGATSFPKHQDKRIADLRDAFDVPQFTGLDAVAKIRELRQEGQARVYSGKNEPAEKAYGKAQMQIAKALEDQVDRHLNQPDAAPNDLLSRYRAARQGKAKLASFERAWKAGNEQQVSATNLGKQLGKGVPLSGPTRTIAESAREFPRAFQDISKLRNEGPLSNLDWKLEGGLGAVKPLAALKAAPAFLAAPALRAFLSSDLYQNAAFGPHAVKAPSALLKGGRALPAIAAGQQQLSPIAALLSQSLLAR